MQDIVSIHLKDTLPGIVREIAFGDGNVDFVSFFRLLQLETTAGCSSPRCGRTRHRVRLRLQRRSAGVHRGQDRAGATTLNEFLTG